jgi:hypothetical protein
MKGDGERPRRRCDHGRGRRKDGNGCYEIVHCDKG